MSWLDDTLAAANRLLTFYNGNEKTAGNPGGMTGVGGMADNWDPCIRDIGAIANGVGAALTATQTSETNAAGSATAAAGSATGAAGSAAAAHADRLAADVAAQATAADRTAVAADRTATHTDRLAADADAAATAADRIAVATDKTAAHADRLAADADAQATAADRLAVAADRTTVAADKTATHTDRLAADAAAAQAQGYAAGLSLPAIGAGDAGKALIVNPAGTGYLTGAAGMSAATGAQAAAGISNTEAVTPAALAGWLPALTELPAASVDPALDRIPIYDASGSVVKWVRPSSVGGGGGPVSGVSGPQSAAFTLSGAHKNKLVRCTGSFTVAITAAATLGPDFACVIANYGSGVITLDPAGGETINGAATIEVRANQSIMIACDGTAIFGALGGTQYQPIGFDPAAFSTAALLSNNNRTWTDVASGTFSARLSLPVIGARYAEFKIEGVSGEVVIGVVREDVNLTGNYPGGTGGGSGSWGLGSGGTAYTNNGAGVGTYAGFTTGDVMGIAHNPATQATFVAKNNTWIGGGNPATGASPLYTGMTGVAYFCVGTRASSSNGIVTCRMTSGEFSFSPPSGFSGF